jgi:asparagine synthase (glutamine-hydrolysing)
MSGIAGIYHLDGRPVDPALLRRMTDIIGHRGPDGADYWLDGPVGLGHRMRHTTPESLRETQPLLDETGRLCLTLDGRVDNRNELRAALESKGAKLRTDTDAELVLRAYESWDEACPMYIIGDFAFVIWDQRNGWLFCARDILGMKPFYYYLDDRTFLCGSEPRQLFEDPTIRREPNEGMIGEYLARAISDQEETLYRSVFRLPPAYALIVQPGRLRKERYWDIDPARKIRYRTDAEYAEHFSAIFKEAVRCRLRSYGPVGAYLSGGLDSSSVVGMVQSFYREGALADHGFETFSMLFPGLPCNESAYIQDVVRMWGIQSNAVYPKESDASRYATQVHRYHDFPNYPNGSMSEPLKALAQAKGFRVLLTGHGGDDWLIGSLYHSADLLCRLRILALIRQVRFDSPVSAMIVPISMLFQFGIKPILPRTARRALRWILWRDGFPGWMEPDFARRIHLAERIRRGQAVRRRFPTFAQEDLYRTTSSGFGAHFSEVEERSAAWFGLEQRHPLHDRRMIEFALALPEEQRWRRDQPKFILRQAMQGLLPESIRQRLTKADFSHVFAEALHAQGGERLFDFLTIASMGWVRGERVREMYREMARLYARGDPGYTKYVWPLWLAYGIELWFNTVFLKRGSSSSKGPSVQETNTQLIEPSTRRKDI